VGCVCVFFFLGRGGSEDLRGILLKILEQFRLVKRWVKSPSCVVFLLSFFFLFAFA
jgi:hypothetical protein